MTFEMLQAALRERTKESFPQCADWTASDWAVALGGESGEVLNVIKKLRRGDPEVSESDLAKELADVICYALMLADFFGIDIRWEIAAKFNDVSERVGSPLRIAIPPTQHNEGDSDSIQYAIHRL